MHGHGLFTTIILPAFCMQVECGLTHYVQRRGELEYPNDPESYAAGSVATGRVTLGGQVEG